jgi:hypothetical protein
MWGSFRSTEDAGQRARQIVSVDSYGDLVASKVESSVLHGRAGASTPVRPLGCLDWSAIRAELARDLKTFANA